MASVKPQTHSTNSLLRMRCYMDHRWENSSAPHSYWWLGTQTKQETSSQPARSKHGQERAQEDKSLWIRAVSSRRSLSKQTTYEGAVFRKEITTEFDVSTGFIIFTDTIPWKCKKKAEFLPGICSRIKYGLVWHKATFPGQVIHSQAFQEDG